MGRGVVASPVKVLRADQCCCWPLLPGHGSEPHRGLGAIDVSPLEKHFGLAAADRAIETP